MKRQTNTRTATTLNAVAAILTATFASTAMAANFWWTGKDIHATGLELPLMYGRPGCPLERFTFSNCSFRRVAEETLPENWKRHGYSVNDRQPEKEFVTRHAVGFVFDNTVFDVP